MENVLRRGFKWIACAALFSLCVAQARAEDRDGWLTTVSRKTMAKDDARGGDYIQEIDRDLALRIVLKNNSMKDREAGTVAYAIIVRRWNGETGRIQRYSGTVDLQALKRGETAELSTAEFHIGGHMHGTSRMHMDEMEAWKLTVTSGDLRTEFRSSGKFDVLDKKASEVRGSSKRK